ncbi:hypothetical protein ABZ721_37935 [Streptomyces sp. NPDC006733]|uniref:hypothetical protein n=1 Tax=Streptomyces sp. NPDC006733 TaxID=3155460 RepID=UPI0033C0290F
MSVFESTEQLALHYDAVLPAGVREGNAVIVVRPPADGAPAPAYLLRVRRYALPLTSMRRRAGGADQDLEDVQAVVLPEEPRELGYPLPPWPATGALEYHLTWAQDPQGPAVGATAQERVLFLVRLLAEDRGAARTVAAGRITVTWTDPSDVGGRPLAQPRCGPSLPAPLREAVDALVRADAEPVPGCVHCAMLWELRLLEQAELVRELAEEHHAAEVADWVARWLPDSADGFRLHVNPCRCVRARLGARPDPADRWWSADPAARPHLDAELHDRLVAARRRHVVHHLRTVNSAPPTP